MNFCNRESYHRFNDTLTSHIMLAPDLKMGGWLRSILDLISLLANLSSLESLLCKASITSPKIRDLMGY